MGRLCCLTKLVVSLRAILDDPLVIVGLQQDRVNGDFQQFSIDYDVEIIATGNDSGLSFTRNRLFEKANTEYVFLLDDDFIFESKDGIVSAFNYIKNNVNVGVVGGKLYDREINKIVQRNYEHKVKLCRSKKKITLEPVLAESEEDVLIVDVVLNFALFRRELFTKYDIKWDENIKINGEHEDYYLTYREKTSLSVVYMPKLYAFHERDVDEDYAKLRYRNDGYLYLGEKWGVDVIVIKNKYVQELRKPFKKYKYRADIHGDFSEKIISKIGDQVVAKLKQLINVQQKEGLFGIINFLRLKVAKLIGGPASLLNAPRYFYGEYKSYIAPDKKNICQFRDKYKGQRCFIIGNGPSLNNINLKKLANEITFGVNGIFYKGDEEGFFPDYYMVEDSHVIADNLDRIISYKPKKHKFFPTDYKKLIGVAEGTSYFRMNHGFYETSSPNYQIPRFSTDFSEVAFCGQSVTMINLQLAYYMGFTEVYLVGMDFSYTIPETAIIQKGNITSTEDDINHFHPDYFGKGKKWHDPLLEQVLKTYELYKLIYDQSGRKIINATDGGKLEVFERVSYDNLFK
jgi:hypothetical protein